jgi:ABC-type glutathione transport system ATPase component
LDEAADNFAVTGGGDAGCGTNLRFVPPQLSGGQSQRIAIAQAQACQLALVIGDEPTASLDSNTTAQILGLLGRLKRRFQTAFLAISHDYSILTDLSNRFMIMHSGRIVEHGSRGKVLQGPLHPYASALFRCGLPLTGAITDLPEHERLVLALCYYEELKVGESGFLLGETESRAQQIHDSALSRLQDQRRKLL